MPTVPGKCQEAYVDFLSRRFARGCRQSAYNGGAQNVYQLLTFKWFRKGGEDRCVKNVVVLHAMFAADPLRTKSVQAVRNRLSNAPVKRYRAPERVFQ